MIFTLEQYEDLKLFIMNTIDNNTKLDTSDEIFSKFDYDAVMSLYGQMFVRNLKSEIKFISDDIMQSITYRVGKGESLLNIAKEFKIGTLKFAKLYLETTKYKHIQISSLPLNPLQIEDERLRYELLSLIEQDPVCSYHLEQIKECLGREYEELLINLLNQKNMCFETEAELRSKGKPKTPDILFLVPMGITCNKLDLLYTNNHSNVSNLIKQKDLFQQDKEDFISRKVVINWIDSKAMFADMITFKENLEQFRAYNNRYGRGMVIYWHGFVEDICATLLMDDMIIIRDHFPNDWIFPTGEPADGRIPAFDKILI